MTIRLALICIAVIGVLGLPAPAAWACSCAGYSDFDSVAGQQDIAVVFGRVVAVGGDRDGRALPTDPRHVDLDVTWVAKGSIQAGRIRVWNLWAGSSCAGAFKSLTPGLQVVVAATTATVVKRTSPELWKARGLKIPSSDLVANAPCGEPLRVLHSEEDRRRYEGRRIP